MKDQIVKFIEDNEIEFNTTDSGLNSAYTTVCGYADHVGASKKAVGDAVKDVVGVSRLPAASIKELDKVYAFTSRYNYGRWWTSTAAKSTYKF